VSRQTAKAAIFHSNPGKLACRSAKTGEAMFVSGNGELAERKLVMSDIWLNDLDEAILHGIHAVRP
jgi:hypothetical protein